VVLLEFLGIKKEAVRNFSWVTNRFFLDRNNLNIKK